MILVVFSNLNDSMMILLEAYCEPTGRARAADLRQSIWAGAKSPSPRVTALMSHRTTNFIIHKPQHHTKWDADLSSMTHLLAQLCVQASVPSQCRSPHTCPQTCWAWAGWQVEQWRHCLAGGSSPGISHCHLQGEQTHQVEFINIFLIGFYLASLWEVFGK